MAKYEIATDAGKVRLLIADVGGADGKSFIFEDNEIDAFLSMGGSVKYAAAQALRTIAANTAQVQARIKYLELSTDGPAVAKALESLADKYEKEAIDNDEDGDVEIAAMSDEGFIP
jgi:hypothetical protein